MLVCEAFESDVWGKIDSVVPHKTLPRKRPQVAGIFPNAFWGTTTPTNLVTLNTEIGDTCLTSPWPL